MESLEKLNNNKKKFKISKLFLAFFGFILATMYLSPIFILLINSFKTQKGFFENVLSIPNKDTFTVENYKNAFLKLNYLHPFFNSLAITIISVFFILLLSTMAAWALVRTKSKISKVIFGLFSVSILIPFQSTMLPLLMIYKKIGLLNPIGLIIIYIGFGVNFSIFIIQRFIKNIPKELEEAAIIDRCGFFQLFFRIIIPLLKTVLIPVAILNIIWIWNDFLLPSIILTEQKWKTLPLMIYNFFGEYSNNWNLATAALFMCITPIIIFYSLTQKYIINGMTKGSIK